MHEQQDGDHAEEAGGEKGGNYMLRPPPPAQKRGNQLDQHIHHVN